MKIEEILTTAPVLPVIVIHELKHAVPLAEALVAGGLKVLEITLRTPVAVPAIEQIAKAVPDAIVGVGTLTKPEQFDIVTNAGAQFAVSPGLTPALVETSKDSSLAFLPGVFTPSEAMQARDEGFNYLKLFPAKQAGGLGMLKAMASPFPDLTFCPTGGIDANSYKDYLALPNVACVGGSWVAPSSLVEAGDWSAITELAKQACE